MRYVPYEGCDVSREESLFEYGFLACQKKNRDFKDEWFVVYMIDPEHFGTSRIREYDLDELINGNDWMNEDDINSLLSMCGLTKDQWLEGSFASKLFDFKMYCGFENVLGTDDYPMSRKEACIRTRTKYYPYGY